MIERARKGIGIVFGINLSFFAQPSLKFLASIREQ